MKKIIYVVVAIVIIVLGFKYIHSEKQTVAVKDYKNTRYSINGTNVLLTNGISDISIPGSSSKITTKYFGSELKTDLDGDGTEDVAFIMTEQNGGTGTFYYVVAGLNKEGGFVGSDGYFIGDRVAPQNIIVSPNPKHKNVIVVNYMNRKPTDPMTAEPSVSRSIYLKIDPITKQWGIVEPNFEGESN